jgi:hypothetical protein
MRKYALVQRLPTGDWWTSLNSDFAAESRKLQDLTTAHAELVAILPSITTSKCDLSLSVEKPRSSTITLGSYSSKKATGPKPKLPAPRSVGCGSFLDYGEYASFAPTFDQVGVEVGRQTLGEVIWGKREWKRMKANEPSTVLDEVVRIDRDDTDRSVQEVEGNGLVGEVGLDGLLPPEEVAMIKSALGSLELENAVHELLERNGRALERLEELQGFRWSGEGGGSSEVRVGSEEWDTGKRYREQ